MTNIFSKHRFVHILVICTAAVIVVFFTLYVIQKKPRELNPERIALVDVIGSNYIFRGSYPMTYSDGKEVIAYDKLTSTFNSILATNGLTTLSDYYLISYSLLDINEFFLAKAENEFFDKNPKLGKVLSVSLIQPSLLIEQLPKIPYITPMVTDIYNSWVTKIARQIHALAATVYDKPVVIYIHCYAGRDRTGMLVSYYKLLFNKEFTLKDLRAENAIEAGRHTKNLYDRAISSYCLYLNENHHKSLHCE